MYFINFPLVVSHKHIFIFILRFQKCYEGDDNWIAVNYVIFILAILHKLNNSVTDRQSLTSLFHGTYLQLNLVFELSVLKLHYLSKIMLRILYYKMNYCCVS